MFLAKFVRESFWGRIIYHASGRKVFNYPEEKKDYIVPEKYYSKEEQITPEDNNAKDEPDAESQSNASNDPSETSSGTALGSKEVIVTWEGEDDPENPYNWPFLYKLLFTFEIGILTAFVYMASAIYTPGVDQIMEKMNVGLTVAVLPLTLFVFGYGIGPMVWSPISENARFGRTNIYIVTLFIFFILQIPTALVTDIASLCVLRFIAGFFASPCLATGGASMGDIMSMPYIPVAISAWSVAAVCAPSMGPMFGSILVVKGDYHWTFWFVCITSGTSFAVLSWFLPESYGKTILYRKAERLRALTGNENITSEGHIENSKLKPSEMLVDTLWRPVEIIIFEPVVLLINLYIGLLYSIMYLWFEAFPIVFYEMYGFTLIEMGVTYTCIMVGIMAGAAVYIPFVYRFFTKKLLAGEMVTPEVFLPAAIVGAVIMPIGLIIFAWTAAPDVHWMGPVVGASLFAAGAFVIFQTLFNYLSMSFWRYLASVFAGNALFRSIMAGAFPLFGKALFLNLKTGKFLIGWGTMILAFLSMAMILIPVFFYRNGPKLRARSKYAN